jgi:hypothetical protein
MHNHKEEEMIQRIDNEDDCQPVKAKLLEELINGKRRYFFLLNFVSIFRMMIVLSIWCLLIVKLNFHFIHSNIVPIILTYIFAIYLFSEISSIFQQRRVVQQALHHLERGDEKW